MQNKLNDKRFTDNQPYAGKIWAVAVLMGLVMFGLVGLVGCDSSISNGLAEPINTKSTSANSNNQVQTNHNVNQIQANAQSGEPDELTNQVSDNKQSGNEHNKDEESKPKQFAIANKRLQDAVIDKVYVDKSERKMYLLENDKIVKTYHIALGDSPKEHKQQEGDERTPEGIYTLDYKNENSIAHRSIHISYPNEADIARAKSMGVSPGGAIMIHGQMNGYGHLAAINQRRDWTDGCIAVTNDEMDEIMDAVKLGTPIEIVW